SDQIGRISNFELAPQPGCPCGDPAFRISDLSSKSNESAKDIKAEWARKNPKFEIRNSKIDVVNEISLLELQGYMANTLLRDTDFMSMAHSLEVRVPFVDSEIVSYLLPLPGKWKL